MPTVDAQTTDTSDRAAEQPILRVEELRTYFHTRHGVGTAVDGVSFELFPGETLGLVGESGCGKSITALSVLRLNPQPASEIVSGRVFFRDVDLLTLDEEQMRQYRGKKIAMVLQDPTTTLNPVFTVGWQILESLKLHTRLGRQQMRQRAAQLLRQVNIPSPEAQLDRYPHQFSGGMRQRVVGAIALSGEPEILIADEPTTALDVTIQAAYLRLLKDIQEDLGLAILFISHDFGVIGRMCDRVAVMYAGHIVETAPTEQLFANPSHPYTKALISSVPSVDAVPERLYSISGQPPSIVGKRSGCPFAPRCPVVEDRCWDNFPEEFQVSPVHSAKCWKLEA